MQWQLRSSQIPHTVTELTEILLANRGIMSEAERATFFAPPSPLHISLAEVGIDEGAMAAAVSRLDQARDKHEDVLIFGDYDADGVCATATLWEGLKAFGIVARPFIPDRLQHGYGLSLRSLTAVLAERKPDLLITVDNGIVAHEAFAELKRLGVSTILTDHHQTEAELPPADIVLHTTQVCGTGVAWFLVRTLSAVAAQNAQDLAGIATLTDQMPLLGINRAFVFHGLPALAQTARVGLQQLLAAADVDLEHIDTNTINYVIGPRLNAMGRLKHGLAALRLLCTHSPVRAAELVADLQSTNQTRQELTGAMIEHAVAQATGWESERVIIVASTEYHEGVIGLLAGKLTETYHKPAIAIALGPELAKASARSVAGVNIIDLIRLIKADLLEAGGHPMAAGFGFLPAKLEVVTSKLQALAREQISDAMLVPTVKVECELPLELATLPTCHALARLAPFGVANREPVLALRGLVVRQVQTIGRDARHLRLVVSAAENQPAEATPGNLPQLPPLTCLAWNQADRLSELQPGTPVDIAGVLSVNSWHGRQSVQVVVKDVKVAEQMG